MRLLLYNIAYGTGAPGSFANRLWTVHRYLRTSRSHLDRIIEFIDQSDVDIVGLVEVDTGSWRTGYLNQVEAVANHLKHYHYSSIKYAGDSLGRQLPILKNQANAVLTRMKVPAKSFHYFPVGFKKLIIELDIGGIHFFLIHLALQRRVRQIQLDYLAKLADKEKPVIIAGDFNTLRGESELEALRRKLRLVNPNKEGLPTFPSWNPVRQLDFILCSKTLKIVDFSVPEVRFSDHLPLILDFEV